ncbi:MAG: hypothetical protein FWG55_02180 [Candidatus Bathyarchaeota archaeon]|nr:hypothetical protein [Candidatus Termiticorpusculum sp.]
MHSLSEVWKQTMTVCSLCTRVIPDTIPPPIDGLCTTCHDNAQRRILFESFKVCKLCNAHIADQYNQETRSAYEAYIEDGLCPTCRKNPPPPNKINTNPTQGEQRTPKDIEILTQYCLTQTTEFFTDQYETTCLYMNKQCTKQGDACYTCENNPDPEHIPNNACTWHYIQPTQNKDFKHWLSHLMYDYEEKFVSSENITTVVSILSGKCLSQGKRHNLANRIAYKDNHIWLDMADEFWRTIKISRENWEIVKHSPILFRRYKHQKALVTPVKPKTLTEAREYANKLFNHLNISEEHRLIFLCTTISYLIPNIPHPILVTHGPQGSAKSTLFKLIRRLVDPSKIELLTLPHKIDEIAQQLDHHCVAFYDNLNYLSQEVSDTFCRAVTGAGFSKRELYTNDDDIIFNIKRCIGFNGINQVAEKGDLLDRSILVELTPIEQRKTESEVDAAFEKDQAQILGGMLTILSEAIRLYDTVQVVNYQRLADFHRWGCAITEALGFSSEDFTKTYNTKVDNQVDETLNNDNVGLTFLSYFTKYFKENGKNSNWEGTPTELLNTLKTEAENLLRIPTNQKAVWPQEVKSFGKRFTPLFPALNKKGFCIRQNKGGLRLIFICLGTQTKLSSYTSSHLGVLGVSGMSCGTFSGRGEEYNIERVEEKLPEVTPNTPDMPTFSFVDSKGRQPTCCFCGGLIEDWHWVEGPLSFENPAHEVCYRLEVEKKQQGAVV